MERKRGVEGGRGTGRARVEDGLGFWSLQCLPHAFSRDRCQAQDHHHRSYHHGDHRNHITPTHTHEPQKEPGREIGAIPAAEAP